MFGRWWAAGGWRAELEGDCSREPALFMEQRSATMSLAGRPSLERRPACGGARRNENTSPSSSKQACGSRQQRQRRHSATTTTTFDILPPLSRCAVPCPTVGAPLPHLARKAKDRSSSSPNMALSQSIEKSAPAVLFVVERGPTLSAPPDCHALAMTPLTRDVHGVCAKWTCMHASAGLAPLPPLPRAPRRSLCVCMPSRRGRFWASWHSGTFDLGHKRNANE